MQNGVRIDAIIRHGVRFNTSAGLIGEYHTMKRLNQRFPYTYGQVPHHSGGYSAALLRYFGAVRVPVRVLDYQIRAK